MLADQEQRERTAAIITSQWQPFDALTIELDGIAASSVTPWTTSATQSLQQQSALNSSNTPFTYEIPAQWVVTFAGMQACRWSSPGDGLLQCIIEICHGLRRVGFSEPEHRFLFRFTR